MTNRQVKLVSPTRELDITPAPAQFSEFQAERNIVLLGDPGAGKTHLFKRSAEQVTGRFVTVREFLNIPPDWGDKILFVDALDEKRAGRADDSIVDELVRKLFASPPLKLRISCREQDWLGESDLEAFRPYFEVNGGVSVLSLSTLTRNEQREVLVEHGLTDIDSFLEEANRRDLGDFLHNPQNLKMLATVVASGKWPATRSQLFALCTELWLSERNNVHSRKDPFSAAELRATAGALCALRLISDVDGFGLDYNTSDAAYPGVNSVPFLNGNKVEAVLRRPVFDAIPGASRVDYVHRTTAEYLAAEWLADQMEKGLPARRVSALLGPDHRPATEVRGLNAWLPTFSSKFAQSFICADPYGVLSYGDPAGLSRALRLCLLEALSELSAADPWFRSQDSTGERLSGMCIPEMIPALRSILESAQPDHSMRLLVLDSLAAGGSAQDLVDPVRGILLDGNAWHVERERAFDVLWAVGEPALELIRSSLRQLPPLDASCIQLRSYVISVAYGTLFGTADVVTLLNDLQQTSDTVTHRVEIWTLSDVVPPCDIPAILEGVDLAPAEGETQQRVGRNRSTVANAVSRSLVRLLGSDEEILPANLWRWLRKLALSFEPLASDKSVREALRSRKNLVVEALAEGLDECHNEPNPYALLHTLRNTTLNTIGDVDMLDVLVKRFGVMIRGDRNAALIYEAALALTFLYSQERPGVFEFLYSAGEHDDLKDLRDAVLVSEIPDWRREDAQRTQERRAAEEIGRTSLVQRFSAHEPAIRAGTQNGWLGWIANVYLANFSDSDYRLSPRDRLIALLGEEPADSALVGLSRVLDRHDIPSVEGVIACFIQGSSAQWWLAVIAALDARWEVQPTLDGLPDSLISAALAIDIARPTSVRDGNVMRRASHEWKNAVLASQPQLAKNVYLAFVRAALATGREYVDGLHELMTIPEFSGWHASTALSLLLDYPNASHQNLRQMLEPVLADDLARGSFVDMAKKYLADTVLERHAYVRWLVAAFISRPDEFEVPFIQEAESSTAVLWLLRDTMPSAVTGVASGGPAGFDVELLERILIVAAAHFPDAPHPANGWSGDQNPWDGSEFIKRMINQVSLDTSVRATTVLTRLANESRLATYRDYVLHTTEAQRTRRRDAEYQQPNWSQAVAALSNAAPANAADLHALVVDTLLDTGNRIAHANNDIYKRFWNEDSYGRLAEPKSEESGRDVLLDFLNSSLRPLRVTAEPEGHMAHDKRADITVHFAPYKIPVELKRSYHADVWHAAISQLDRLYTPDPDARGYGVYCVLWFGQVSSRRIPRHTQGLEAPKSAEEMSAMLCDLIPVDHRSLIAVVVIDVSGQPRRID
ncbi:hypothetical protein B2G74_22240 [Burkholderia sp. A27]|nr:hypothetical protein B2G74_22240 [Burkholderia sp. A27]